jgi:hypothetical protein
MGDSVEKITPTGVSKKNIDDSLSYGSPLSQINLATSPIGNLIYLVIELIPLLMFGF